jgi:hypothetical protein
MRRTLDERSGCTFVAANSTVGGVSVCVANRVARGPRNQVKGGGDSVVGLSAADHG